MKNHKDLPEDGGTKEITANLAIDERRKRNF